MAGLGRLALAALGILAYQNRDKLAEILKGVRAPSGPNSAPTGSGSVFDQVLGGGLGGGLADLLDRFRNAGKGEAVDSWVKQGPNEPITPTNVEQAIDNETLDALIRQTGMSREEILERLSVNLPKAVDEASPDGELPTDDREPTLLDPAPR